MKKIGKNLLLVALASMLSFSFGVSARAQTSAKRLPTKNAVKYNSVERRARKKKGKIKKTMNQIKTSPVSAGAWGANGIALTVTDAGAQIQYDCATGEITEKLSVDGNGNFTANGTHTRLAPGPIRVGHEPQAQPARYTGKVMGDTMTLKIVLAEGNALVGEYTLEKGKTPRLHRCL